MIVIKAKRFSTILPISLTLLFYLLFLFLYLQGAISEISYLAILLISLLISIVVFRKKRTVKMAIPFSILLLLFCYELPLIGFTVQTHIAKIYLEPRETVERSGIFIIGIEIETLNNMDSKPAVQEQLTKEHKDVLTIIELTNPMVYKNKNRTLLSWLTLNEKSPKEEMREHLREYFGKEEQRLTDYFNYDLATGDSSGLAILLTELMINGTFQNNLPIAVTGAINGKGDVTAVGGIKEKIQIAEKYGFQFMIIPSENSKEAKAFQKELNTDIRIFDVDHVDEAVEQINYLNENYK